MRPPAPGCRRFQKEIEIAKNVRRLRATSIKENAANPKCAMLDSICATAAGLVARTFNAEYRVPTPDDVRATSRQV